MGCQKIMALAAGLLAAALGALAPATEARAVEARVAVAANFQRPMERLVEPFRRATGHALKLSFGSTGAFHAQIASGAPFDVLLAADEATPNLLERDGRAVPGTRFVYATGRLALWSADRTRVAGDGAEILRRGAFRRLAIADPKVAPYGVAAQQALEALGLWSMLQAKLVVGQNIAQTLQFAATGNAELAFVAEAQLLEPALRGVGSAWLVPLELHAPIAQAATLLLPGAENPAARALLDFLAGPEARAVIAEYGYLVPAAGH